MQNSLYRFGWIPLVLCCSFLYADENRTWTDDTGLFRVEASLSQIDGNAVKLKKTDGTILTLPIAKLSEADKRYIADLAVKNPFEGGNATTSTASVIVAPALPIEVQTVEVKAVDLSQTRDAGSNMSDAWTCKVDPAPAFERPEVVRMAFRFPDVSANLQQRHTNFFLDSTGKNVLTTFQITGTPTSIGSERMAAIRAAKTPEEKRQANALPLNRASDKNFTRIVFGNAATGTTTSLDLPLKLQAFGFSPDGKRALLHQDDWDFPATGKKTLLHIIEQTPSGWKFTATFEPFAQLKRSADIRSNSADIYWATWVDDEHLLVQAEGGTLILLNIKTGEALWQTLVEGRGDVALSPGKKYCVLPVGSKAILRETMSGKTVGSVDNVKSQKFQFSPDGKHFATCSMQGIMIGDTATGTLDIPFFVSGSSNLVNFFWLDDRFLFFGGDIVDTTNKATVWTYTGLRDNVTFAGGYCWSFFGTTRLGSFLCPLTIPHAKMTPQTIPADAAEFALKQDTEVTLVLEESIEKEREEIQKCIEKKIADNGWVLADAAPVSIVLKIETEETDEVKYTTSRSPLPIPGPPRPIPTMFGQGGTAVEFQPERYLLTIMQADRELWKQSKLTQPPQWIKLDEIKDASLQEVVDQSKEQQSYQKWLDGMNIPKTIARLQDKGATRVTENGFEEIGTNVRTGVLEMKGRN
ncbi:MAG: hypothetical protein LBI05_07310 [Planctomycetaceae bacterium]|nr:hypothetical protein [Planctomycetaceae bacterium]